MGFRIVAMISRELTGEIQRAIQILERKRGLGQPAEAYIFLFPGVDISRKEVLEAFRKRFQLGIRPKVNVFDTSELSYTAIFLQGIEAFRGKISKLIGEFKGEEGTVLLSSLVYSLATESVRIPPSNISKSSFHSLLEDLIVRFSEKEFLRNVMVSVRDLYVAVASLDPRKVGLQKEELRREIRKVRKISQEEVLQGILMGIERDLWEIFSCGPDPELNFSLAEWCCRRGHMYLAVRYLREAIISSLRGILGEFITSQELKEIEEEMKKDEEKIEAEGILEELKKKLSGAKNPSEDIK